VLTNLNTHPALGADFDAIDPAEAPEALTLAPTDGSGAAVQLRRGPGAAE
jgi:hypothetical protein